MEGGNDEQEASETSGEEEEVVDRGATSNAGEVVHLPGEPPAFGTAVPLYLILNNISKKTNVKTLLTSAEYIGAEVIIGGLGRHAT